MHHTALTERIFRYTITIKPIGRAVDVEWYTTVHRGTLAAGNGFA